MIKSILVQAKNSVYDESPAFAFIKSISTPFLRSAFYYNVSSIFFNFFFRQFHAVLVKRVPVSKVDHALDKKIPFVPAWITIYHDFTFFWIRMVSFFLRRYGRRSYAVIKDFIISIGDIYSFAAQVYKRNFSTTDRPFYISSPRFLLIHLADPHLMCIPSLHVMVVFYTYKMFLSLAQSLGEEQKLKLQLAEMKQGALAITQAILFVKQHSVNCIPAALYSMTCFDSELCSPKEAEDFISLLFSPPPLPTESPAGDASTLKNYSVPEGNLRPSASVGVHPSASPETTLPNEDQKLIKEHILNLYNQFLSEKSASKDWYQPLLNFLKSRQ